MGRKDDKPKRPKRVTAKQVQAAEDKPFVASSVPVQAEIDEDAWGDDGLTLKQRRFCEYYVGEAGGVGVKAAKLAGYRDDNYHVLGATAHENLKKPKIRSYIGMLLARQGMTPDFLRSRLATLAAASMDNFATIGPDGDVQLDLRQAAELGALGQLKEIREEVVKGDGKFTVLKRTIKVHDPIGAIRTLAEMHGMLSGQSQEPDRVIQRRPIRPGLADADNANHN